MEQVCSEGHDGNLPLGPSPSTGPALTSYCSNGGSYSTLQILCLVPVLNTQLGDPVGRSSMAYIPDNFLSVTAWSRQMDLGSTLARVML